MEKLKEKITMPNLIIAFIILQPIIDIITCLSIKYLETTITVGIVIRTVFMIFISILGFIKADKKYKIGMCIYYGALLAYMVGFMINSYMKNGTDLILLQIKGLIKSFYFPIILVALIPTFKAYKIKVDKKIFVIVLMICVITIIVCDITGIGVRTYKEENKVGTMGFFYSANEISAILCLLSPFLAAKLLEEKIKFENIIFMLLYVYAIFRLGTKVPYFGLIILIVSIIFACIIYAIIKKKKYLYKRAGILFICLICIYLVTGITPVGKNLITMYGDIFLITEKRIQDKNAEPGPKPETEIQNQPQPQLLEIKEFESFEELTNKSVSGRADYLKTNKKTFLNGNVLDKMLGIGFVENKDGEIKELKLTEMDYFDILFSNGIIGTILFAIPMLIFAFMFISYSIQNKNKITIDLELIYSIVMAGAVALIAGHVLVSPGVSIYIAIILVRYDYEMRNEDEEGIENNNTCTAPFRRRGRKNNSNNK